MEQPKFTTLLFYMFLSLALLFSQYFVRNSSATTIPLIFPNSPESPLYVKNQTRLQTIERLLQHSTNRANSLFASRTSHKTVNFTQLEWTSQQDLRIEEDSVILLKLGIGTLVTPPYKLYYLHFDTGSELTWLQCEDCQKRYNKCFGKPPIFYENSKSSSYRPITYNTHELCFKDQRIGDFCSYTIRYGEGSVARGILAIETFTFGTNPRLNDITRDVVFDLVFGCNNFYHGPPIDLDDIGVLGFGWGPRSFISQISTQVHGTFSYCFPHYDKTALGSQGYLKLGIEGDSYDGFTTTSIRRYGDYNHYYLNLEGISVDQQRLSINPRVFVRDNDQGGTLIDSGSSFTTLVSKAYKELKKVLEEYFKSHANNYVKFKPKRGEFRLNLCYKRLRHEELEFPSITLHFIGDANLVLKSENVFIWLDNPPNAFCLAMKPSDDNKWTIIGAYQQSNFRFIYDRNKMLLLFKSEDNCPQGA